MSPRRPKLGARFAAGILGALLLGLVPQTASAQELLGRVLDRNTAQPIANVDLLAIRGDSVVARTTANEQGAFRLVLPAAGEYGIWATQLGYLQLDTARVRLEEGQRRLIDLLLDPRPVRLEGIEAVDERGAAFLRMSDTWQGFLVRHRDLPPLGSRRAVRRGDPEMAQAMGVRDVLQWFVPPRPCMYWFVEARLIEITRNTMDPPDQVALYAFEEIEAVEFYRNAWEAPVVTPPCDDPQLLESPEPSVVMIWMRRNSREPRPDDGPGSTRPPEETPNGDGGAS